MPLTTDETKKAEESAVLKKYLETKTILIADPSASSRSGLFAAFHQLGAPTRKTILANTFAQAREQIETAKPDIVVAEYELGKRCGLELMQTHREQHPEKAKKTLFIIVTGNTSQTAVARAAEEDIDAYILKPFTNDSLRRTVLKAALDKIRPPQYVQLIEKAKEQIAAGNLDEAEKTVYEALKADQAPSLAYYYLGQIKFMRKIMNESKGSYERGLDYNKIHYKCMVGLYELLMDQKLHGQAYEVVKRISQYFPANPKRLAEVLRLAVMNGKYEDIERYYSVFVNIDERDETLIRYVCAALVVCGKYYLTNKVHARALELFNKAAATGSGRPKVLGEIVIALVDAGHGAEARKFLAKFPPEKMKGDDYLILEFLITCAENETSIAIHQGRGLLQKGIKDERLFAGMIEVSCKADLLESAESITHSAISAFPSKKEKFEEILARFRKPKA